MKEDIEKQIRAFEIIGSIGYTVPIVLPRIPQPKLSTGEVVVIDSAAEERARIRQERLTADIEANLARQRESERAAQVRAELEREAQERSNRAVAMAARQAAESARRAEAAKARIRAIKKAKRSGREEEPLDTQRIAQAIMTVMQAPPQPVLVIKGTNRGIFSDSPLYTDYQRFLNGRRSSKKLTKLFMAGLMSDAQKAAALKHCLLVEAEVEEVKQSVERPTETVVAVKVVEPKMENSENSENTEADMPNERSLNDAYYAQENPYY